MSDGTKRRAELKKRYRSIEGALSEALPKFAPWERAEMKTFVYDGEGAEREVYTDEVFDHPSDRPQMQKIAQLLTQEGPWGDGRANPLAEREFRAVVKAKKIAGKKTSTGRNSSCRWARSNWSRSSRSRRPALQHMLLSKSLLIEGETQRARRFAGPRRPT